MAESMRVSGERAEGPLDGLSGQVESYLPQQKAGTLIVDLHIQDLIYIEHQDSDGMVREPAALSD